MGRCVGGLARPAGLIDGAQVLMNRDDVIISPRCRMLGWIARSWDEPELRFIHLRPMGSSQQSIITGRRRHGFGQLGKARATARLNDLQKSHWRPGFPGRPTNG